MSEKPVPLIPGNKPITSEDMHGLMPNLSGRGLASVAAELKIMKENSGTTTKGATRKGEGPKDS